MRILMIAALCFSAPAFAVEPDAPEKLISPVDALGIMVQNTIQAKMRMKVGQRVMYDGLLAFYARRRGKPVWIEGGAFINKVEAVRQAVARADEYGLNPNDYAPPADAALMKASAYPDEVIAAAEVDMSVAAVLYATHAQSGRTTPQEIDEDLDPSPEVPTPSAVLQGIMDRDRNLLGYLEGFHPTHPQFLALKEKLSPRAKPAETKIPTLSIYGPELSSGISHPEVEILRTRLRAATPAGARADTFDDGLEASVKAFQRQNGLSADGIVGPNVRQALQPASTGSTPNRKLILANMERWRWVPRNLGERHVRVNLPEFLVRIVENDRATFEERIVIGTPGKKTPIFSNRMRTVVFNPYWNIPASIAEKEILPSVGNDPYALSSLGMEAVVLGKDGKLVPASYSMLANLDPDKIMIRQLPGRGNALGQLKFLFPNKHDVYLHDTPTKYLFDQKVRAFSHGCMRVRNPKKFAEVLLKWSEADVQKTLATGGNNQEIPLEPRIPVHITYFTVWVNETGELQSFRDIYGHDSKVIEALRL